MKTTIGILGLLSLLAIMGDFFVHELRQMSHTNGDSSAALWETTTQMTQEQENQQQLKQLVKNAMYKTPSVVDER